MWKNTIQSRNTIGKRRNHIRKSSSTNTIKINLCRRLEKESKIKLITENTEEEIIESIEQKASEDYQERKCR